MAFRHIGGKDGPVVLADGVDKIHKMADAAGSGKVIRIRLFTRAIILWPRLVVIPQIGGPFIVPQMHPSFGSVEKVADANAVLIVGIETANFELKDLTIGVFKDRHLRVRRFLVVVKSELAADAFDFSGHFVFSHTPAGNVHLVWPLVAQVRTAEIPKPVPIIMNILRIERAPPRPAQAPKQGEG